MNVLLFFKFKNYSSFRNDSSLLFCILIFNPSVLKIKQFPLDLYNQKLTNKETYRKPSVLAHLLLLTLITKYKLPLQIIFY